MRPELRNSKPKRGERAQHRVGFVSFFSLPAECLWSPCHAIYALSHIFYTEPNAICPSTSQQWSCSSCVPKFIFDSFSLYSLKRTVFFLLLFFKNSALCFFLLSQGDSLFRGLFCCCTSTLLAFFAHSLSMHFYHHHHPSVLLPYLHTHIFYSHLKYLHLCHVHFSLNRSLNARVHTLNRGNAVCCSCCCCRSRVFFSRAFFFSLANVVFLLLPFVVVSFPSFLFFSLPTPHPL